ncbi:SDR family NAD(P)-dependent oxidoreductase [Rhizobium sullae]|uniref:SDR family NAD(P)-dependent oxidoreductase n=1 Tax=Rhizobium sullae TaxID=50338 RepID=UPI001FD08979|nr:SDR family NAD(P)-dependent oxidoreductase [Rhizobium sullae]
MTTFSDNTRDKLMQVSVATISTALFKRGLRNQTIQDVQPVLDAGYRAVLTARRTDHFDDLVAKHRDAVLVLELDVTNQQQIDAAVSVATDRFGAVDVLVNNAGYGYLAAIEEGEDAEMRALFETDLFAPINLIKAVLPGMRAAVGVTSSTSARSAAS